MTCRTCQEMRRIVVERWHHLMQRNPNIRPPDQYQRELELQRKQFAAQNRAREIIHGDKRKRSSGS